MSQANELKKDHLELSNAVHYALMLTENILKRTDLDEDQRNQYLSIYEQQKNSVHNLNTK